ncbi:MAG: HD domain-containing protein [Ginsengibacter sp.]
MAMANYVYPGAVHTRFHHSLGAYHLMCNALDELRNKGVEISPEEDIAAKIAILLHDIGHGPFSHALEHTLIKVNHEDISLLLMQEMNKELNGRLDLAIDIFTDVYPRKFLHQLVSGQLDVDRMDYITRDSFFSGVSEGTIGYDRILKMLTIHNDELMIEEKGIYSIEKFLVSRRLMYWQVYLHKTVLSAEKMLVHAILRAKEIGASSPSENLNVFLKENIQIESRLEPFCGLDDYDIINALKLWVHHPDKVLSCLSRGLINRKLFKIKYFSKPVSPDLLNHKQIKFKDHYLVTDQELDYLVFTGSVENRMYNSKDEHINILFKDGSVKEISMVDNALINQTLFGTVKKFYLCYPDDEY